MDYLIIKNVLIKLDKKDIYLLKNFFNINKSENLLWLLSIYIRNYKIYHMLPSIIILSEYFNILKYISKGEFGEIYKAIQLKSLHNYKIEKPIAIKLIKNIKKIHQVEQEIYILKTLKNDVNCHPSISCYYDSFATIYNSLNYYAIIMEYIDGYSLGDFYDKIMREANELNINITEYFTKIIPNFKLLKWMRELLGGLAYIHSKNVLHRDIHLGNIMYDTKNNRLVYIDFGISCLLEGEKYNCKNIVDFPVSKDQDIDGLGNVFYALAFGTMKAVSDQYITKGYTKFDTKYRDINIVNIIRDMSIEYGKTGPSASELLEKVNKIELKRYIL